MTDKPSPDPALSAACDALGDIMHALNARQLLAKGCSNAVIRAKMEADALPDATLLTMAGHAFEAAALELARRGDPNVTVFSCNPTEEPDGSPCADITAFADGELAADRAAAFRVHLAGCAQCQTQIAENVELQVRIKNLPLEGE